jgi:predicted dehydrogenase
MAESCHKVLLDKTPGARLLAVWDITETRRAAAAKAGVPRIYSSFAALLRDRDIDAVSICTPSNSHVTLGLQALRAGKHVLVEKPAARSAAELRKFIAAARRARRVLTVFHNRRFDSDFLAARDVVRRQLVGRPIAVEARWHMYGSTSGFAVPDFRQNWRDLRRFAGGFLMDLGVHLLDQLNQLAPARPVQVFGALRGAVWTKECDDYAAGFVIFEDGLVALMETGGIINVKLPRWRIIGTRGMAVSNAQTKAMDLYLGKTDKPTRSLSFDRPSKWGEVYRTFAAAIRDRKKRPAVDPESVVTTMQLVDAYRESSRTGRSVAIAGPRAK